MKSTSGLRLSRPLLGSFWIVFATLASLAMRVASPAWVVADSSHDDMLYARLGGYIADGQWLGAYDRLTLAKGPAYSLFIAVAYEAHLPLKLTEQVVHLVAAAVVALAVGRICGSRLVGVVTYSIVALDPAYLGAPASKISRDALYGSASLFILGALLLLLTYVPNLVRRGPRWWIPIGVASGVVLGITSAGYYLCREERSWMAPALLVAMLAGLAYWRRKGRVTLWHGAVLGSIFAATLASFAGSVHWVSERNDRYYGTHVTSDIVEGNIARAFAQWQRVDAGVQPDRIPVSRAQRAAVYEISPAAAELEPVLENPANPWIATGCTPATCEYNGALFAWTLRDAATDTGHMGTGREAQRFFGEIADDIEAACGDELTCTAPAIGPLPPLSRLDLDRLWSSYRDVTVDVLTYNVAEPERPFPSGGHPDNWDAMTGPLRGIDDQAEYRATEERLLRQQWAVSALTDVYRWGCRIGVVLALLGLVLGGATSAGRRQLPALLACLAALAAVLTRVALVAVLEATAFDAVGIGIYILPGVDFLLLFVILACGILVDALRGWLGGANGEPEADEDTERSGDDTHREAGADMSSRDEFDRLVPDLRSSDTAIS